MNVAKRLISLGTLTSLPFDAGPILRIIVAESEHLSQNELRCNFFALDENFVFEHSNDIFPFFRLYSYSKFTPASPFLIGYANLFGDGVGRIMLLSRFHKFVPNMKELCSPCLCKAGHLLVLRFRVSESQITCSCDASTLKCIENSWKIGCTCPISGEKDIPFRVYQTHAIAIIDQRARFRIDRISGPR